MDENTKNGIRDAVQEAFSAGIGTGRFVDLSRIPLICQTILSIDQRLKEIAANSVTKEAFWPVKTLVYGITALMLTTVVGSLLLLVLRK